MCWSFEVALTDRPSPTDRLQAIVSTQHRAAAVLLPGAAGLAQGADAMVHHPAVAALRRCVRLAPADAIALPEMRAAVTLRDGRQIEAHGRDAVAAPGGR
jgi:MmgE/PrpD C-terminal domain